MNPISKRNIVWLASYPKSGNTWFRYFLTSLFANPPESANINRLKFSNSTSSRIIFDKYMGFSSSDLTEEEINNYRPNLYRTISLISEEYNFFKTHDAWGYNSIGHPLFPKEITKGALYFIRNPLDIAVSLAFHNNEKIDKSIQNMNCVDFGYCENPGRLYNQLPQYLSSWSQHVTSWITKSDLPIKVIRYEDMINNTLMTFTDALDFLELKFEESVIIKAISNSSFEKLQMQEMEYGFNEKNIYSERFFRKGKVNDWTSYLNKSQINILISQNRTIMEQFGYLLKGKENQ